MQCVHCLMKLVRSLKVASPNEIKHAQNIESLRKQQMTQFLQLLI